MLYQFNAKFFSTEVDVIAEEALRQVYYSKLIMPHLTSSKASS